MDQLSLHFCQSVVALSAGAGLSQSVNEVTDAGTEVPLYPYLKYKHNF